MVKHINLTVNVYNLSVFSTDLSCRLTLAGQCGYPFILAKIRSPGFQSRAMLERKTELEDEDKGMNTLIYVQSFAYKQ